MGLIKINDRFSFEKDTDTHTGWTLHENRHGVNPKTKKPSLTVRKTYWPDPTSLLNSVIDRSCDEAGNVGSLLDVINKTRESIFSALKSYKLTKSEIENAIGGENG